MVSDNTITNIVYRKDGIVMNLRQKYKKLKKENEKLKRLSSLRRPVLYDSHSNAVSTVCAEISFDRYEYSRMIDDDIFDTGDYVRGRLIDEMRDELLKYTSIDGRLDYVSDRVILRGELKVVKQKGETNG